MTPFCLLVLVRNKNFTFQNLLFFIIKICRSLCVHWTKVWRFSCPSQPKKNLYHFFCYFRFGETEVIAVLAMLAHAIDNPAPSTIVLISGDRDFAYALSTLRLRRYHIVLITLSNAHQSLTARASLCFNWISDSRTNLRLAPTHYFLPRKSINTPNSWQISVGYQRSWTLIISVSRTVWRETCK